MTEQEAQADEQCKSRISLESELAAERLINAELAEDRAALTTLREVLARHDRLVELLEARVAEYRQGIYTVGELGNITVNALADYRRAAKALEQKP